MIISLCIFVCTEENVLVYAFLFGLVLLYLVSFPIMAAPANDATGTARPKIPTINVCVATSTTVSSGISPTAANAAAADAKPAPPMTGAGMEMASAKIGRRGGAKSTRVGKSGRSSGPAASTKTRICGLSAANCNNGSNLAREIPAACALDSRPDWATFDKSFDCSTLMRRFLTAMLLPRLSTTGVVAERVVLGRNAPGCGAKAVVVATANAEDDQKSRGCVER